MGEWITARTWSMMSAQKQIRAQMRAIKARVIKRVVAGGSQWARIFWAEKPGWKACTSGTVVANRALDGPCRSKITYLHDNVRYGNSTSEGPQYYQEINARPVLKG